MELKQKRIWDKRHFKLLEEGVWLRVKTPTEDAELKIKYEELGLEIVYIRKKEISIVFGILIFLSAIVGKLLLEDVTLDDSLDIFFVITFSIFLFAILLMAWSESRKPLVGISGGEKAFTLLRNSPNSETVDLFITELHERIINRIIKLRVRPDDPEIKFNEKKRMLDWLKEENIIGEKKYHEVLQQIAPNHPNIGF